MTPGTISPVIYYDQGLSLGMGDVNKVVDLEGMVRGMLLQNIKKNKYPELESRAFWRYFLHTSKYYIHGNFRL